MGFDINNDSKAFMIEAGHDLRALAMYTLFCVCVCVCLGFFFGGVLINT